MDLLKNVLLFEEPPSASFPYGDGKPENGRESHYTVKYNNPSGNRQTGSKNLKN